MESIFFLLALFSFCLVVSPSLSLYFFVQIVVTQMRSIFATKKVAFFSLWAFLSGSTRDAISAQSLSAKFSYHFFRKHKNEIKLNKNTLSVWRICLHWNQKYFKFFFLLDTMRNLNMRVVHKISQRSLTWIHFYHIICTYRFTNRHTQTEMLLSSKPLSAIFLSLPPSYTLPRWSA